MPQTTDMYDCYRNGRYFACFRASTIETIGPINALLSSTGINRERRSIERALVWQSADVWAGNGQTYTVWPLTSRNQRTRNVYRFTRYTLTTGE